MFRAFEKKVFYVVTEDVPVRVLLPVLKDVKVPNKRVVLIFS